MRSRAESPRDDKVSGLRGRLYGMTLLNVILTMLLVRISIFGAKSATLFASKNQSANAGRSSSSVIPFRIIFYL